VLYEKRPPAHDGTLPEPGRFRIADISYEEDPLKRPAIANARIEAAGIRGPGNSLLADGDAATADGFEPTPLEQRIEIASCEVKLQGLEAGGARLYIDAVSSCRSASASFRVTLPSGFRFSTADGLSQTLLGVYKADAGDGLGTNWAILAPLDTPAPAQVITELAECLAMGAEQLQRAPLAEQWLQAVIERGWDYAELRQFYHETARRVELAAACSTASVLLVNPRLDPSVIATGTEREAAETPGLLAVAEKLRRQAYTVDTAGALPATLEELRGYRAVYLDSEWPDMTRETRELLRDFVAQGGGLLLAGGTPSLLAIDEPQAAAGTEGWTTALGGQDLDAIADCSASGITATWSATVTSTHRPGHAPCRG
jgi:hypothetical protein